MPSFAIVVSPDGLVVDGPGWDRPNGAGDPRVLHVGQEVFYLENQLVKDRPFNMSLI